MGNSSKKSLYSSLVWLFSALFLFCYCFLGLFKIKVPGVQDLVLFTSNTNGPYIYIAVFTAIFIEGLYIIGNFFPGSTLVAIILVLSQVSGLFTFLITIMTIFIGWSIAGFINIYTAHLYRKKFINLLHDEQFNVNDKSWVTWFPSFRSNYEVAQVIDGGKVWRVYASALRVRFYACVGLGIAGFIIPYVINIKEVSNEEGFISLFLVAVITLTVGLIKLKNYFVFDKNLRTT